MKKILVVISFLLSMVITVAHDAIHHHHGISENIEIISDSHSDDQGHNDNDDHNNNKNYFPPHHHVISDCDFISGRTAFSSSKVLKDSHRDFGTIHILVNNLNDNTYFTGFVRVIIKPLGSYPFIISLNSTR